MLAAGAATTGVAPEEEESVAFCEDKSVFLAGADSEPLEETEEQGRAEAIVHSGCSLVYEKRPWSFFHVGRVAVGPPAGGGPYIPYIDSKSA